MRNDHPAKVALRTAAHEWANGLTTTPVDKDAAFKRLDDALLRAARRYAYAAEADAPDKSD